MSPFPLTPVAEKVIDNRRLISGLKQALDLNHARVLDAARNRWERNYGGKDPSDACVSVRVSSGEPGKSALPCGGILRKPGQWFPNGNRPGLLA